jgi:hypothetical protein
MDVFNTFIELLRQTGNLTKGQMDMDQSRQASFFSLYISFFTYQFRHGFGFRKLFLFFLMFLVELW